MYDIYLGLGTNLGDRYNNLKRAVGLIGELPKTEIIEISNFYETKPWGYKDQDNFFNLCLRLESQIEPYKLLEDCQRIEKELKRERGVRWGPRTLDIDILLYGDCSLDDPKLTLPHPRISERDFVLWPLLELNRSLIVDGQRVEELAYKVGREGIVKVKRFFHHALREERPRKYSWGANDYE